MPSCFHDGVLLTQDSLRTEEGQSIDFRYQGVIKMAPEVKKIFEMSPEAATVPFGFASE